MIRLQRQLHADDPRRGHQYLVRGTPYYLSCHPSRFESGIQPLLAGSRIRITGIHHHRTSAAVGLPLRFRLEDMPAIAHWGCAKDVLGEDSCRCARLIRHHERQVEPVRVSSEACMDARRLEPLGGGDTATLYPVEQPCLLRGRHRGNATLSKPALSGRPRTILAHWTA